MQKDLKMEDKIIKLNRGDWSGKTIETKIEEDGSFTLYGYRFEIKTEELEGGDKVAFIKGNEWREPLGRGYLLKGVWVFKGQGISREDENMYVAAIQLLCMII